eukprot:m.100302 g.100302  ORF g.100302 m.100302 type:complete len:144 (-) comp12486_c0_seq2:860-1291(-)
MSAESEVTEKLAQHDLLELYRALKENPQPTTFEAYFGNVLGGTALPQDAETTLRVSGFVLKFTLALNPPSHALVPLKMRRDLQLTLLSNNLEHLRPFCRDRHSVRNKSSPSAMIGSRTHCGYIPEISPIRTGSSETSRNRQHL